MKAETKLVVFHDPERCRVCQCQGRIKESRKRPHWGYRRRRYECPTCRRRWTTYELRGVKPRRIYSHAS